MKTPTLAMMTMSPPLKTVRLAEWDEVTVGYQEEPAAFALTREQALSIKPEALHGKVDLQVGINALKILTSSFVGNVEVGGLRLVIQPKISGMPLATLLRYAYGLRDLSRSGETHAPTMEWGFHDLLVSLLVAEVEELVHRGLAKSYVRLSDPLESPRGRLDIDALVRNGGPREARLPCHYFERRSDSLLNQVLRAGLELAASLTSDRDLRRAAHKLLGRFQEVHHLTFLDGSRIRRAEQALTRLTEAYIPALTLIRLLVGMQGVDFEAGDESRIPGFLFDMNSFYQRLLSRFLRDNLVESRIEDEYGLRSVFAYAPGANPKRRQRPTPRPDFALFKRQELQGFLDAKYRDAWSLDIPASWLYQLSIYALVSPSRVSVLLYPTLDDSARDEQIELRHPLPDVGGPVTVSVILRPVHLGRLAKLVTPRRANALAAERQAYARNITQFTSHQHPLTVT